MDLYCIKEFINILMSSEEKEYIDVVEELIVSAGKFIELTCELEGARLVGKYTKDYEENSKFIKELNSKNVVLREEFKNNLKIIERLCSKETLPDLFQGNIEEETELKNIAMNLINNLSAVS
ncbi:DUF3232 domain-containing protein [Clostridium grantii]|uniref:Uncharacterized protein n=1 Tax=Clostridium grantii DSM 8605 TaxID=1121316 RepID=A0A1M5QCV2_9CLOT|nr:DUF3232 domain-containing protein [Clostridium grantii]SHH12034.1 Protein of unknown function [Clostridium grantii DSM 8605]